MTVEVFDRVRETTVTTGTGTVTLVGAGGTTFRTFAETVGNNGTCPYSIEHRNGQQVEVGLGTVLTGPDRLQRDTVYSGSNGTSKVDFTAGLKDVRLVMPADLTALLNKVSSWTAKQIGQTPEGGGTLASITPNPSDDATNPAFNFNAHSFANGPTPRKNFVVSMGHNIDAGGGLVDPTKDGMRVAFEGSYEPTPGTIWSEFICAYVPAADPSDEKRFLSFAGEHASSTLNFSSRNSRWAMLSYINHQHTLLVAGDASASWYYLDGTRLSKSVNNETWLLQQNAAGNGAVSVAYVNASDLVVLGSLATVTMGDAQNFIVNTNTGTKIGTATGQKLGFWNANPIIQPASVNQAALSLDVDITGADTVDKAAINTNFTAIQTLVNQLRNDLVAAGLIKGAA